MQRRLSSHNPVTWIIAAFRGADADERGSITAPFAASLIALIFFMGLSVDVSMVLMDHGRLDDMCQVVAENRYVHQDAVRFADDPAQASVAYVADTLAANGFEGTAVVDFEESPRTTGHRHIAVTLTLTEESPFYFLRMFGANSVNITSTTTFEDDYGEDADDVIWAPAASVTSYNGSYEVVF